MFAVMTLLCIVALGLHLNPTDKELLDSIYYRFLRLVFSLSIAIFIPAVIQYTFWDVSEYDLFIFHPVIMFTIGTVFAIGLQLLIYGRLSSEKGQL